MAEMAALRKSFLQGSQHSSAVIKHSLLCSDFWLENLKKVKLDSRDRFVSVLIFNLSVPSAVVSVKHFSPFKTQTELPNIGGSGACAKSLFFFQGFYCAPLTFFFPVSILFSEFLIG